MKSEISIWEQSDIVSEIKNVFGKGMSDVEFSTFLMLGRGLGADPFKREIWAVNHGGSVNVFLGRDFYRRKAQEQSDYNGHSVDVVYENDEFSVENGIPKHSYRLNNRGKLIGAYCTVYRKGVDYPYFVSVEFSEYYQGCYDLNQPIIEGGKKIGYKKRQKRSGSSWEDMRPTNWDTKPATMIKKVAESQGLRGAYQGIFAGTYDESESWFQMEKEIKQETKSDAAPSLDKLREIVGEAMQDENPAIKLKEIKSKWEKFGGDHVEQGLIYLDTILNQYE